MSTKKIINKRPQNGRFSKGRSGNPAGRPVGSRNRSTVYFENMLSGDGESLVEKAKELALKGDTMALRLCLERICPARKERTIDLELPAVTDRQSFSAAVSSVMKAVADGRVTPGEAEVLVGILQIQVGTGEVEELSRRVGELELMLGFRPDETCPEEEISMWAPGELSSSAAKDEPQTPSAPIPASETAARTN